MAFNIGGTGEFTEANITTLLGLATTTANGFNSGSRVGLDTTSGNMTFGSVIANPNSGTNVLGLRKLGTNTLTLNQVNTYTGATTVTTGTLQLGINSAIPSGSAVTLGDATTSGTLDMGSFTNSIASLAFGAGNGTLKLAANQTGSAQLSASGTAAFGTTNTLDLTGMGTSAGVYKLVSGSSISGTFITVTGMSSAYTLKYGTLTANELDAQHKADQSFTSPAGTPRALVNTSVALSGTLTNTAPSGSAALAAAPTSTGTLSVTGLSSSTGATVAVGSPSTITGSIAAGATAGTFGWQVTNTDANAVTSPTTISGSINAVNQRSFSAGTIALGRFLVNTTPAGTTAITSAGLNAVTANASLGSFSGTNTNGLTLSTTDSTAFNGGSASQTANYTIGGSVSSVGALSGASFSSGVTAELGSIGNVTANVTGSAVASRTVNDPASTSLGNYHVGGAVSVTSNAFGYSYGAGGTGTHATTEDTTVQTYGGSADANGITLSGAANSISSNSTFTRTFTGTAAMNSTSGSFNLTVNPELSSATSVTAGYTIGVYSGQGVWNTNGGGTYGTLADMSNWTTQGGAPGLDSSFASSDTATFGIALTGGNATVNLNGAAPSLKGIIFSNVSGSYFLANGSLTLNNGGNAASLTDSSGSNTISADVILASNLAASVLANATLAVSGVISGSNKTLDKTGAGTLTLSGNNTYSGATTVTDGTLVVNGSLASSSLEVGANATLGGTGTIAGDTTIAGTHNPGNSPGIQNFGGNLTYSGGSAVNWELAANTNINAANPNAIFDTVVVAGNLSFNGLTDLNLSFKPVGGNVIWSDQFWQTSRTGTNGWLIYDVATGTINNPFSNLNLVTANWLDSTDTSFNSVLIGSTFSLYQNDHSIYLAYTASTVTTPEPSSGVAMAVVAVLGGAVFLARRRKVQS